MFKKILMLTLVLCLILFCTSPVQAQNKLEVLTTSTEVNFPNDLTFKISAQSDVKITEIRLQYSIELLGFAQVVSEAYVQFSPSTKVDTQWKWDLVRIGGLPPGTVIKYQWIIVDASGGRLKTSLAEVNFDDSRFSWKTLTEDKITIYWYDGTQSFAQEIMQSAQSSLARLSENTGAYIKEPIRMYIYGSDSDLLSSMIFPQEWSGGVAFTRYGCIAIGISSSNLDWGKGAIAHELTHLITEQMTLNPYNELPTWLDEGLAMYNEGPLDSSFTSYLNQAIKANNLISIRSLSSPFSAYADKSYLSYAESYSIVDFLISTYGENKMFALLDTFRQGSTYDGALHKVYGFDMDGLNTVWQKSLTASVETVQASKPLVFEPAILRWGYAW
ncbi:MAG: peptidase MA family metallohydrolase [Chloroflexi bacterium]|nr:peptidase MA family metallohydrolase [Chloroflexota bacterium]